MAGNPRVSALIEEMLDTGRTPEEVCRDCPELLPEVLRRWRAFRLVDGALEALFPNPVTTVGAKAVVAVPPPADLPQVPGYRVEALLGRGGMGVVYRAWHVRLKRTVALKMLLAGPSARPEELERFLRESQAVAGLRHANIVQLYDVGEVDGRPFFTMEFVEGGNLASQIQGIPQPLRQAAALVVTLAEAIHTAHQSGFVHRDLKPANILLTADGTPKITDFGLARRLEGDDGLTLSGAPLGTPSYMAPEQARGDKHAIGPGTDVYALGALLYELLTGRPPFRADSPTATLQQVITDDPVPPARLNPRVPRDLQTICLKCLHKEQPRRYATAADLAADLTRFLENRPIRARPVGRFEKLRRWAQRNPIEAFLASTLIVTGLSALAAIVWQWQHASALAESEANSRALAQADRELAEDARRRAEHDQARLMLARGQSLCERGEVGAGLLWLVRGLKLTEAAGDSDLVFTFRANLAAWAERLAVGQASEPMMSSVTTVAFRPRGRGLLVAQAANRANQPGPGFARIWDPRTWQPLSPPLEHPGTVLAAAFSPDGRLVLTAGKEGTVRLWEPDGGKMIAGPLNAGPVYCVAFAPDGRTFATGGMAGSGGEARIWQLREGLQKVSGQGTGDRELKSEVGGHGPEIASHKSVGGGPELELRPLTPPLPHAYPVRGLAFSPDGKTLLTGSGTLGTGGEARFWDVATARPAGPVLVHTEHVGPVIFSRDGQRVLTASTDGLVRQWDRISGEALGPPIRHASAVSAAALSPDGRTLLTGGARSLTLGRFPWMGAHGYSREAAAYLWDLDTATLLAGPLPDRNYVKSVAFRPDGKCVAVGTADGNVRTWTLLASRNNRSFAFDGAVRRTAFSHDGRYIVVGRDKPIEIGSQSTLAFEGGRFGLFPNQTSMAEVSVVELSTGNVREVYSEYKELSVLPILALTSGPPGISTLVAAVHVGGSRSAPSSIQSVACSPTGEIGAATSRGGYALLFNLTTARRICPPIPIGGTADSTASFSPDGRMLLTSCRDGPVRVWDAATGKPVFPALPGNDTADLALFSPDGGTIAAAGKSGHIDLWDTSTGRLRTRTSDAGGQIRTFAFSHDGRTLLAGCDGYALRFDASTGACVGPRLNPRQECVWETRYSRDDNRFLTLAGDGYRKTGFMQIWDAASGQRLGPPVLDALVVPAATFHPGGQFIATGDWEGKARLWDAQSATPIGPALGAPAPVESVAFSPDGRTLAVGAHDGTLTLWPIPVAMRGTSEQIQAWLEWATARELDESGVALDVPERERNQRREALDKQGGTPLTPQ